MCLPCAHLVARATWCMVIVSLVVAHVYWMINLWLNGGWLNSGQWRSTHKNSPRKIKYFYSSHLLLDLGTSQPSFMGILSCKRWHGHFGHGEYNQKENKQNVTLSHIRSKYCISSLFFARYLISLISPGLRFAKLNSSETETKYCKTSIYIS